MSCTEGRILPSPVVRSRLCRFLCPPCRHIRTVVHSQPHATVSTKLLFFSSNVENGGFVLAGPPALGAGSPRFKSGRPDQTYLACFLLLIQSAVHLKPHLWNSGRQECSIRKSFSFLQFARCRICKNTGRQECYSETIERTQVNRPRSGKYGENSGDSAHFSSH